MRSNGYRYDRDDAGRGTRLDPLPGVRCIGNGDHVNTLDRAGRNAEFAAGAKIFSNRVHLLGGTNDGIDGAGLYAECASDTDFFIDDGHLLRFLDAVFGREGLVFLAEQLGQFVNIFIAAGWSLIDVGLILGNRFGIRTATGEATLAALGLRQHAVNLFDQRVTLDLEAGRRIAQQGAQDDTAQGHDGDCVEDAVHGQ